MNKTNQALVRVRAILRGRYTLVLLATLTGGIIGRGIVPMYRWNFKQYEIKIAAGSDKAESFALMEALGVLMAQYYPRIHVTAYPTAGSTESLQQLENNAVQMAAAQADIPPREKARTVAVLFQDRFQVLVHQPSNAAAVNPVVARPAVKRTPSDNIVTAPVATTKKNCVTADASAIKSFADLRGKTIALQKSGGQFQSFLFVAKHFGLTKDDFKYVGGDDDSADSMFAQCDADAVFRVRSLHAGSIQHMFGGGDVSLIPIDDALALYEMNRAYQPAKIPKGYYTRASPNPQDPPSPPNPPVDIDTISTSRLLLARSDVDEEVVYALTEALMDHRSELALAIRDSHEEVRPLAAFVGQPTAGAGGEAPIHPGAISFYNKNQSSFIGAHVDSVVWLSGVFVLVALCVLEFRRTTGLIQKRFINEYYGKMLALTQEAETSISSSELVPVHAELTALMAAAIEDLRQDKMSQESFHSFHTIWEFSMEALVRKQYAFDHPPETPQEIPQWPLARLLHPRTRN